MTAYEIVTVLLEIISILISFGCLVIALLTFLKQKSKRKKMPHLSANR